MEASPRLARRWKGRRSGSTRRRTREREVDAGAKARKSSEPAPRPGGSARASSDARGTQKGPAEAGPFRPVLQDVADPVHADVVGGSGDPGRGTGDDDHLVAVDG